MHITHVADYLQVIICIKPENLFHTCNYENLNHGNAWRKHKGVHMKMRKQSLGLVTLSHTMGRIISER